jgi:hypothetical protein
MKSTIIKNLSNIPGWRTKRKIVVIESDDWGSIRMPSLAAFERLEKNGVPLSYGDSLRYNRNDTLANEDDLMALFETLLKIKDKNGNPAVFTPISLVANPDFEKIREHNFEQYFYEPFTSTLEKYYGNNTILDLWKEGINKQIFVPQFHGREHLNVAVWMRALQKKDTQTHLAFNEGCWGFKNKNEFNVMYQAAFDLEKPEDLLGQHQIISEGLQLFETLFGYKASYFVPPNGPFNNELEKTAAENGIQFMSCSKIQNEAIGNGKIRKRVHYLGQINKNNQQYITRNCSFEPSQEGKDWVQSCLNDIEIAFRWNKPALISTHRVNYIGALNEKNRKKGLLQLESLLLKAIIKWPDLEFMTSKELGLTIIN